MNERAWIAWAGTVTAVALLVTNPLYLVLVILCVVAVASVAPSAPGSGPLRPFLAVGAGVLALSTLLSLVNGTPGDDVLFSVPGPDAPAWLGGLRFGGPVTREGLVIAATRALGVMAIFGAFAVVTLAVSPARLVRATPSALSQAGLIVSVGLATLPAALDDLRRIREAERLRGYEVRWWRFPGLIAPAVLGGLERSVRLAEAMEARGFGDAPAGRGSILAGVAAMPAALLAAYLWMAGGDTRPAAVFLGGVSLGGVAWWLLAARRSHPTTRLQGGGGAGLTAAGACLAVLAVALMVAGRTAFDAGLTYNPLLDAAVPPFSFAGAAVALLIAWPFAALVGRPGPPAEEAMQ